MAQEDGLATYPEELRYTEDHEWIDTRSEPATVGVSFFAQKELGDVVFVELPEVGRRLKKGDEFGTIESVKAVSELYIPVGGEIVAVNEDLREKPELINEDPYGRGWIVKMKVSSPDDLGGLLEAAAYREMVEKASQ